MQYSMKKKYSGQITFRTTEEILRSIERLAESRKQSKTDVLNNLLSSALSLNDDEEEKNTYQEMERRLSQKIDKQIMGIKKELETAIKK